MPSGNSDSPGPAGAAGTTGGSSRRLCEDRVKETQQSEDHAAGNKSQHSWARGRRLTTAGHLGLPCPRQASLRHPGCRTIQSVTPPTSLETHRPRRARPHRHRVAPCRPASRPAALPGPSPFFSPAHTHTHHIRASRLLSLPQPPGPEQSRSFPAAPRPQRRKFPALPPADCNRSPWCVEILFLISLQAGSRETQKAPHCRENQPHAPLQGQGQAW